MVSRHTYYDKEILWSLQLFPKTDLARESVYLTTIERKLTLNLIIIFNSSTDISFVKYITEIFCDSYYFQEKNREYFKVQPALSYCVCVYFIMLLISCKENFLLKLRSSKAFPAIFFWKFADVLGQHLKSLLWKIIKQPIRITPIFCKQSSLVFFCFFSYINRNHKDITHP